MNIKNFFNKIDKKSSNSNEEYTTIATGCSYLYPNNSTTPAELIAQNKHFVYACTKKIEQYISSVPIHTYYYGKNTKSLFVDNKPVAKHIIKNLKTTPNYCKKADDIVEITDVEHPLNTLLMHPAEGYSYTDWISIITSYLILTGNALLEIVKEGESIKELVPLKWEHVYPHISDGKIIYYNYTPPSDRVRTLLPEQVIHLMNRAPGSLITGKGNLEACIESAALYSYYDAYQTALARNYSMLGISVNVKNKVGNKEEAQQLAEEFIRKYGRSNTGKPIITFGDVDVKPISITPKDMDYIQGRDWAKKTICACLGVPEDLVDVQDSNRASSVTAIKSFIEITIYPLLNKILEQLNTQVVEQYYDDKAYWYYDPQEILAKNPVEQADILTKYVSNNIISIDEARAILELEPIEIKE